MSCLILNYLGIAAHYIIFSRKQPEDKIGPLAKEFSAVTNRSPISFTAAQILRVWALGCGCSFPRVVSFPHIWQGLKYRLETGGPVAATGFRPQLVPQEFAEQADFVQ